MKRWIITMILCASFTIAPTVKSHAIVWVVVKAAIKKVIKAMDLAVQRAQNEVIGLQNTQKAIENALSKLKLNEIADWSNKEKELFNTYYDELWKVKNLISLYNKAREVIRDQKTIVEEYTHAIRLFSKDQHFSPSHLETIKNVYGGILTESVKNFEQVTLVINSFATQMSDSKRMEIISDAAARVASNLSDLREYTNQNILYSLQKAKDQQEISSLRKYFGLNQ